MCAKLIGKFVHPEAYLFYALPIVREQVLASTLHKASTLYILSSMISTAPANQLLAKAPNIIEVTNCPLQVLTCTQVLKLP
jgi:hypothetical protein